MSFLISHKQKYIDIYSAVFSLALICHIFNQVEIAAGVKLFYVPVIFAFIITLVKYRVHDKIKTVVFWFVFTTLLGSALSPNEEAIGSAITFCLVIISALGLRYVDAKKVVITTNMLIPFALVALWRLSRSEEYFRFEGYYNDPNYLCTSLLVLQYIISLGIKYTKKKVLQVLMIIEILVIFMLVGLTVSRTGLICCFLLLIGLYWNFLKTHFGYAFIIIMLLIGYVYHTNPEFIQNTYELYQLRKERGDTLESASETRWKLSATGLTYVFDNPAYLPFGIGSGGTTHSQNYTGYPSTEHGDHNSWTSCFTEHGLIGFTCFITILGIILKEEFKKRSRKQKIDYIKLLTLGIILLFSFSISMMLYLPFWWIVFFISNITNENTSYCLLR